MPIQQLFTVIVIITGILIAGEAIALLVGMHFLSPGNNPWISIKNDLLLGLDIVIGLALIYSMITGTRTASLSAFYILVGAALLTHGFREYEYLARLPNRFCVNQPLFILNNLKLIGSAISIGIALMI